MADQGFAKMSDDELEDIARRGGEQSGGKFEEGSSRASEAGKDGAKAQSKAAKAKGGRNSHRNDS